MSTASLKSTPTILSDPVASGALSTTDKPPTRHELRRTFYYWRPVSAAEPNSSWLQWGVHAIEPRFTDLCELNERQSIKFEVDISGGTLINHYRSPAAQAAGEGPIFTCINKPFGIRLRGMGHRYIRWQAGSLHMSRFSNIETGIGREDGGSNDHAWTEFRHGEDTTRYLDVDNLPVDIEERAEILTAFQDGGTGWVDQSSWVGQYYSIRGLTKDRALITISGPGITGFEFADQASRDMVRTLYWFNPDGYRSSIPLGGSNTDPETWEEAARNEGLFRDCKNLTIAAGCKFPPDFTNANGTFMGCTSLGADIANVRWKGCESLFYTFAGVELPGLPEIPAADRGWKPSSISIKTFKEPDSGNGTVEMLSQYPFVEAGAPVGGRDEYLSTPKLVTWHAFNITSTPGVTPPPGFKSKVEFPHQRFVIEPNCNQLRFIQRSLMEKYQASLFVCHGVAKPCKLPATVPEGEVLLNLYRGAKGFKITIGKQGGVVRLKCYGESRYFTAYEACDAPPSPPSSSVYAQSIGPAAGEEPGFDYSAPMSTRIPSADIIKYSVRDVKLAEQLPGLCECPDPVVLELLCLDSPKQCSLIDQTRMLFEPTAGSFGVKGVVSHRTWYINRIYKDKALTQINDYQVFYLNTEGGGCGASYFARHYEDTPRVFEARMAGAYANAPSGTPNVWEGVNVKTLFDSIESAVSKYPLVVFKSEDGRLRGSDAVYSGVNQAAKPLYGQNEDDFIDNQVQVWGLKYDPQTAKGLSTDVVPEKRQLWAITNPTSYVGPAYFTVNGLRLLRHAVAFTNSVQDGPFRIPGTKKTLYSIKGGSITVLRSDEENFATKVAAALNGEYDEVDRPLLVAYDGIRESPQIYIPVDGDPPGLSVGTQYQTESLGNDRYRINGAEYQGLDLNGQFYTWRIDAPWETPDRRVGTGDIGVPNSILTVDPGWTLKYHTDGNGVEYWLVRSPNYHECLYNYHYILTNEGRMLPNGALDPGARAVAAVDVDTTKYHYDISIFSAGDSYWWEHGYDYPNGLIGRGVVPPNAPDLV